MSQNRITEGDMPHFVDHDQWVTAQLDQLVLESVGLMGGGQAVDPLGGGGECDPVACLAGSDGEFVATCVLPVPGGPRKTTFSLAAMKSRVPRCASCWRVRSRRWVRSSSSTVLMARKRAARMRPSPPWASRAATSRCRQATRYSRWVQDSAWARSGQPLGGVKQGRGLQGASEEGQVGGGLPAGAGCLASRRAGGRGGLLAGLDGGAGHQVSSFPPPPSMSVNMRS